VELLDTIAVAAIALLCFALSYPRPRRRRLPMVHPWPADARLEGSTCARQVDLSAGAWTWLLESRATHLVVKRTTRSETRQVVSRFAGHVVS
jgi:hypothetical protein